MKTGWKDMYFKNATHKESVARKDRLTSAARNGKIAAAEHRAANANIGSDAEIAAYLARVPKPYHYVEGEES